MHNTKLMINGQWIEGQGEFLTSTNPATNEVIWQGSIANEDQVNKAVLAARQAFLKWKSLSFKQRLSYIETMRTVISDNQNLIAQTICAEMGKPLWEATTEVTSMINKVDIAVKAYHERTGKKQQTILPSKLSIQHKPHGVIAIFSPFNFPAHMAHGQIVPALLAGNTLVLKPSELTPSVAALMLQLWEQSDLPKGVLNLVQGGQLVGQTLAQHSNINALFFTGSYTVGKQLHKLFAGYPEKLLVLEMGGNNPLIISQVNDLKAAAYMTIQSAYITSGQRCTCARRLLVAQGDQGDAFLNQLIAMIKTLRVDHGNAEPAPFMGPLVTQSAAEKVMKIQTQLRQQGAVLLHEAQQRDPTLAFVTPGLIDVTSVKKLNDEECFGPLLQLQRYQTLGDAVLLANRTKFGLTSGLLSDDPLEFEYFFQHSEAGLVNWNQPLSGARGEAPFGGIKCSGNFHPNGSYTADTCAYPVSSSFSENLQLPKRLTPGFKEN